MGGNGAAATATFTYDAAGNCLTSNNVTLGTRYTYTLDAENRLSTAQGHVVTLNQRSTYVYNGDGQRVEGDIRYIWDGQNVLVETDGSNATLAVYTLEPKPYGNLISQRR